MTRKASTSRKRKHHRLAPGDVRTVKGQLYVSCRSCGTRSYLGMWGAAHVGSVEITATCEQCGARLTITRGATSDV